ncbi:thermonuclease family protein [Rhizobium sp. TH2]|uniref:thermonuclease family protein n=1 Tax=Rhizobium sp. TH2 TaxID=2775403 RepID=UPI0035BE6CA5
MQRRKSRRPQGHLRLRRRHRPQHGLKWRLLDIDAPEIQDAACPRERSLALRSRDRLAQLMAPGYSIQWNGRRDRNKRALLSVTLPDGRDAGRVLIEEGLAQPWPNVGNVWCE